jgi:two-component system CheB/CheR fusion protein
MKAPLERSRLLQSPELAPAVLVHELRQPLHTIRLAVRAICQRADCDSICEIINRQVDRMERLIDEQLDVVRQGHARALTEDVDLGGLIDRIVRDNRRELEARGLSVAVDVPPDPVVIAGDLLRLEQALVNLVQNAAKHTHAGGRILVGLTRADSDAVVSVRDTGSGINAAFLQHVFEPFAQAEPAADHGVGLGLAIVRDVVVLHGGRIEAYSEGEGRGAEFVIRLPTTSGRVTCGPGAPAS